MEFEHVHHFLSSRICSDKIIIWPIISLAGCVACMIGLKKSEYRVCYPFKNFLSFFSFARLQMASCCVLRENIIVQRLVNLRLDFDHGRGDIEVCVMLHA